MPLAMSLAVAFLVVFLVIGRLLLSVPSVRLAVVRSPAVRPVVMQALGNYTDSEEHAKYFLLPLRSHRYAEARSVLTPRARRSLSAAALQAQWAAFEGAHGRVTGWSEAGAVTNLLPEYVDRRYQVSGSRGGVGVVTLRMVNTSRSQPPPGFWQVDAFTVPR